MVKSAYRIEDIAIKKGDIVVNKDKTNNGNGKDKGKPWNKNKYVVNDEVMDTPKTKEPMFNLSNAIYTTKQQVQSHKPLIRALNLQENDVSIHLWLSLMRWS